jgi:hypothetical protein
MVDVAAPTSEEVAQAKAEYTRALDRLVALKRAMDLPTKLALVGRCFKHTEMLGNLPWPVYIAITGFDTETMRLTGWHFQQTPVGQIEIAPETDLLPEFFADADRVEITRAEFIVAFNELLTAIAAYSTQFPRMPA